MQAGISFTYTDAHYYKTVRNLLGGESSGETSTISPNATLPETLAEIMQNDIRYPDQARSMRGDVFGYDYNIRNINARAWVQNQIETRHWNVFSTALS